MDRTKYTVKCLELLPTNHFIKLYYDPTKSNEGKIEFILRKFKNRLLPIIPNRFKHWKFLRHSKNT